MGNENTPFVTETNCLSKKRKKGRIVAQMLRNSAREKETYKNQG